MVDDINKYEKKINSQNGEDGIIEIIFNTIGITNKFFVEFGVHKTQCNTLYLKNSKGWGGLWIDGNGDGNIIKKEFITKDNINDLFKKYNTPPDFDLLSIDIDGNDYYIWEELKYSPRVLIMEYNSHIPPTESKSIVYDETHTWKGDDYYGASLLALVNLNIKKGYTLIGCDTTGTNCFFIRNDCMLDRFSVRDIKELFREPKFRGHTGKIGHPKSDKKMINI